jgi:hypothetical protein
MLKPRLLFADSATTMTSGEKRDTQRKKHRRYLSARHNDDNPMKSARHARRAVWCPRHELNVRPAV